jgi:ABC-type multidrug transport system ATPase subunit
MTSSDQTQRTTDPSGTDSEIPPEQARTDETPRETPGERTPLLTVDGVSKSFGDLRVLDDVSFVVERSSVVALAGPNGSGKSTLLRIVAGLTESGGRVTLEASGPRRVGYLPQSPAFRPGFTVGETLSFYAALLPGEPSVEAALERVGLSAARDRRVEDLSGGMRRLLGLAQASLGDPALLLLDEPTSDLDPRMTAHVFGVVDDLAAAGASVVLATHDPRGVDRSDVAMLLADGRIVARGPPAEFRDGDRDALAGLFEAAPGGAVTEEGVAPMVGAAARQAEGDEAGGDGR